MSKKKKNHTFPSAATVKLSIARVCLPFHSPLRMPPLDAMATWCWHVLARDRTVHWSKTRKWPLTLVAACSPPVIQSLGHTNYAMYELAHELAQLWFKAKSYTPGVPLCLFPGDFWAKMHHRLRGRFCEDCHDRIIPDMWREIGQHFVAPTATDYYRSSGGWPWGPKRLLVITRCRGCFHNDRTRKSSVFIISMARNSPLGALLSVRPLAIRVINYLLDEYDDARYCSICDCWVRTRADLPDHFATTRHCRNAAKQKL